MSRRSRPDNSAFRLAPALIACVVLVALIPVGRPVGEFASGSDSPLDLLDRSPAGQRATTTQPAPTEPPVRFGAVLPLSGELSPYGRSARRGLELAVAKVNRQGGVVGRPIELLVWDTQSRQRQAGAMATRAIIVDGVEALIGGLVGPTALAIRPVAERRRIPFLVLAGGYRFPSGGSRYTCRVSLSDVQLAEAMACFARKTLRVGRAFVLSDVEADQPTLSADRFSMRFVEQGGQLAAVRMVGANCDVDAVAEQITQTRPGAVFCSLQPDQLIRISSAARKSRVNAPVLSVGSLWSLPPVLAAEAAPIRPAYFAVAFALDDPDKQVRQFVADLLQAYPKGRPDTVAALAHDSVLLLAEAARQQTGRGGELRDRLVAIRDLPTVLGPTGFDDRGQIVKPAMICRLVGAAPGSEAKGSRLAFVQRVRLQPLAVVPPPPASQPAERAMR